MFSADILLAPVVKDVPIKYDVVRFNGSLLEEMLSGKARDRKLMLPGSHWE